MVVSQRSKLGGRSSERPRCRNCGEEVGGVLVA
jgi:hypothetical protein